MNCFCARRRRVRVGGKFEMKINASKFVSCVECKDHMYRMVIVEGRKVVFI